MKIDRNLYLFLIIIFVLNINNCFAHKEPTHQYILNEAKKLLEIAFKDSKINFNIPYWGSYPTTNCSKGFPVAQGTGTTMCAIWNEDQTDLVYAIGTKYTGGATVSLTHFYDPDKNDEHKNTFGDFRGWFMDGISYRDIPNALTKAKRYAYGEYDSWLTLYVYGSPLHYYSIKHTNIIESMKMQKLYVYNRINYLGYNMYGINEFWGFDEGTYTNEFYETEVVNSYNSFVLGNIAHLLGDMSVPAHVHIDEHGTLCDFYENHSVADNYDAGTFCGEVPGNSDFVNYWTAERVFKEKGSFINPFCNNSGMEPIKYLMYSTAHIADHFASRRVNGDDNFTDIGEISKRIEDDLNSSHPGPTVTTPNNENHYDHSNADLEAIRDATIPYVIRATAGLLYWYGVEADLFDIDNSCLYEYINLPNWQNHDILAGVNYHFKSEDVMNICYQQMVPTVYRNLTIESSAKNVVFQSTKEIKVNKGFHAKRGSEVVLRIGNCTDCTSSELNLK